MTALLFGIHSLVTLSLLAAHVDPRFLTGQPHHEGGIVFFLFTLALAAPFFAVLHNRT